MRLLSLTDRAGLVRQLTSFAGIGLVNTLLYVALFNLLYSGLGIVGANACALVVTVGLGFVLNRRVTFQRREAGGIMRELKRFVITYAVTAVLSTLPLVALDFLVGEMSRVAANVAGVGGNVGMMGVRFGLLRMWVFAQGLS